MTYDSQFRNSKFYQRWILKYRQIASVFTAENHVIPNFKIQNLDRIQIPATKKRLEIKSPNIHTSSPSGQGTVGEPRLHSQEPADTKSQQANMNFKRPRNTKRGLWNRQKMNGGQENPKKRKKETSQTRKEKQKPKNAQELRGNHLQKKSKAMQ